jgi:hypothetical protein
LAHYHHPNSSESYYLNTAGAAYTALDPTDARRTQFQSGTVSGVGTVYFVGKWPNFTVQSDYAPVLRYAEVLLNYAEAIARGGTVTQQAVDMLNAVRRRSFPAGVYTLASFATASNLIDAILLERNIEFLGEGMRNKDLLRTLNTIPGKTGAPNPVPSTSTSYIWPIPDSELSSNKLMTGNGN